MPNLRHMRVRELLKRELNEIFRKEFPVDLGMISVSEVGVSNDLHTATCLLYTSPSPRDVEESRMPSSA